MKYGAICLIIFCVFVTALLSGSVVGAAAPSWTDGPPTVYRTEPTEFNDQPDCPTYKQKLKVEGLTNKQDVCILSSDGMRVGSFREDGGASRVAIAFPLDSDFHILAGVCEGITGCLYSADRDTFVSRYGNELRVYKDAKNRIHRVSGADSPLSVRYDFDTLHPFYVAQDASGTTLPIGAIALSSNGKWLVMEIKDLGVGLVNLETGVARRVIATGDQYGRGFDPREELAVSNDGTGVVIAGDNAGFMFVSVDPGCGDGLDVLPHTNFSPDTRPCAGVSIDPDSFIQLFSVALAPRFDDSGEQLEFVAGSRGHGTRRVVLRAAGYVGPPELSYLALGDSFSSGEGETDDRNYELGTDDEFEKCHVSTRSYPFLLAAAMQLAPSGVKNVACSGAKTRDIHSQEIAYWGQGGRLGPMGLALSSDELLSSQTSSLLGFLPGRLPQEAFVRQYQPSAVSIGIGGNDAGLIDKLKVCAMPGTCEWAATQDGKHALGLEIQGLFSKLVNLYQQLRLDAPFTHFYAIGYPEIMSSTGACDPLTSVLFNATERTLASRGIMYLDRVIKTAAGVAKIPYLDIEHSLAGRELCEGSNLPEAVNGLRFGNDIALSSLLPMLKIIGKESFHPNPTGHELIAQAILRQQPNLLEDTTCQDCAVKDESPQLPDDWGSDDAERGTPVNTDFVTPTDMTGSASAFAFSLPAGSFEPGSTVTLEVHSDSRQLGAFVVDSDGGVSGESHMPLDLETGFHTIHLYGHSFSHQPVDLYQVVSFGDALSVGVAAADTPATPLGEAAASGRTTPNVSLKVKNEGAHDNSIGHSSRLTSGLVVVGAAMVFILLCFVLWRAQHNSSQDRGG